MPESMEQPIPVEQVLAQLRTRGFETGGFRIPLRWFRGKLDTITGSMVKRGRMTEARLEVLYNFSELEVFESIEPYPFPIAQINVMYSTREKSGMGVLGASIDKVINAGLDGNLPQEKAKNQDFLIGKVQEWRITPGHMMWDMEKQAETPRDSWEVTYVEGIGGTPHSGVVIPTATVSPTATPTPQSKISPTQQAINLLEGRTQQEWNQIVFTDTVVRLDPQLPTAIINNTFIPPLLEAGIITKDDNDRFHVVKK